MAQKNTSQPRFEFERPESVEALGGELNVILAMGAIASRLTQEERTRTIHPDGRRENVAEHGYMLAKVAVALADTLYPWLDRGKVAIHAINHDDVEAYVGDTPTDIIAEHDPQAKAARESRGAKQLIYEYEPLVPTYTSDIVTYEAQEEYEAQFVRIIDKMMVVLIHIPNAGATLRENYTHEQFVASTHETERKLLEQYPHFIELITMRTELALHVGNTFIRDWQK